MILAVDIGNTRIKVAVFEDSTIIMQLVFAEKNWLEKIGELVNNFPISDIIASTVGWKVKKDFEIFSSKATITFVDHTFPFPFINKYSTPETLGIDRMVLASGSVLQFPNTARLIIDAGTCITYDFVDDNDIYYGGAISPGLAMRYQALNNYTARLPLLDLRDPGDITGNSTENSLHSGVVNGVNFEIDGFIDSYRLSHRNIIIILTGGDSEFLAKRLKNTIFANSNFLLESLNQTYQYKSQND